MSLKCIAFSAEHLRHPKSPSWKFCFPKDVLNLHKQMFLVLMECVITELCLSNKNDVIKE